jgi:hypothetical protein
MDRLLHQLSGDTRDGRYTAVVAAPREMVDLLFSRIGGAPVELVIDGDEAERAAASPSLRPASTAATALGYCVRPQHGAPAPAQR